MAGRTIKNRFKQFIKMKKEEKFKEALEGIVSMMDGPVREAAKEALRLADEIEKVRQAFEPVYRIGDRFKFAGLIGGEYILANMCSKVALINLEDGNHFYIPVTVGNPFKITSSEFSKITMGMPEKFYLI